MFGFPRPHPTGPLQLLRVNLENSLPDVEFTKKTHNNLEYPTIFSDFDSKQHHPPQLAIVTYIQ